jgi:CBS domain-containing membrane protein
LQRWLPSPATANRREQLRAAGGALLGIMLTAVLSQALLQSTHAHQPDRADRRLAGAAVCPAGQPAGAAMVGDRRQRRQRTGGRGLRALAGPQPALLGRLAAALACGAMPPCAACTARRRGGADTVIGGAAVQAAGFEFVLMTVLADSILLVLMAITYNNLTGRSYPHQQQNPHLNPHATKDAVPTVRLGFKPEDLDAVLQQHNQVLDISRDDLESLFMQTEQRAYQRRFGIINCEDIMSRDTISAEFGTGLAEAWRRCAATAWRRCRC